MTKTAQSKEKSMRAVALDRFGGPETLKIQTVTLPETGPDEILIRVEAAGVGAWDPFEREGRFVELLNREPKFPYVLGTDGAGTVAKVGENIDRFKEGDRVYALELANPKGGFYAEYAAVNGNNVSLVPSDLTMEQAAAMPSDALTALRGLDDVLRLQRDESVMIFGASGGIDAALVTAGGEDTDRSLSAIRADGRIAHPNGVMPVPNPPTKVRIDAYDGEAGREAIDKLNRLIETGPFEVHVDRTFSLEEVAAAHAALNKHHLGKIVLKVA